MREKGFIISSSGFILGFLLSTIFTSGVPLLLYSLVHYLNVEIWFFLTLLGFRLITIALNKDARFLNVLVYPASFLIGILEGAMVQMVLWALAILIFSLPLVLSLALVALLIALFALGALITVYLRKPTAAYVLTTYTVLFILGSISNMDFKSVLRPYTVGKCYKIGSRQIKKIFTYPECLEERRGEEKRCMQEAV